MELFKHFNNISPKNIQMTERHLKRQSKLIMKRNAKQNPMRYNIESIRLATIKQTNNNKYSKQFRKLKPLCIVGGKKW